MRDFGVDFSSTRTDGIGLAARLDMHFEEYAQLPAYTASLRGTHIPYRLLGRTGVRRINIGPRGDGDELPKLVADLYIVSRRSECARYITFVLSSFCDGDQPVAVGRPISAGRGGSQFGAGAFDHEAFQSLRMRADALTGSCVLEGMVCDDESVQHVELARSGEARTNGTPMDAYRFGNSCLVALGATSLTPHVWLPQQV
jgi:hypothetical protein